MDESGKLIRIYPMPFRLVGDEQQFKKWQWITARIEKAGNDHRPESHKIYVDTINCDESPMPSGEAGWRERRQWLAKIPVYADFAAVEQDRQSNGNTLALLRPSRIVKLEIKETSAADWTDEEKAKLLQMQMQVGLFDEIEEAKTLKLLRKIPYDFHYRYECDVNGETHEYRHKLVDWEVGALFWKVHRRHGAAWEAPFRQKLEQELPAKDLLFMLGTIHRFPNQWLIVSLIYPPKQPPEVANQLPLFSP